MLFTPDEVPTPAEVLPLAECAVPDLMRGLRLGIGFADDLQPDPDSRDWWYWSHSARWRARGHLLAVDEQDGWGITPDVPNSGIHLRLRDLHDVRVLRSLGSTVPHPGRNRERRRAYQQSQPTLRQNDGSILALSLLMDWEVKDDDPVVHVSLPKRPWEYNCKPDLYWRVPVTGDAEGDLSKLSFDPGLLPGDVEVTIKIDPSERIGPGEMTAG
jgi:hypothetical protein